jgi:hypothetical protein
VRRVLLIIAATALTACATSPRAADGPRPVLGPSDSIDTNGRASVATVAPSAEPAPWRPPRSGPFCVEIMVRNKTGICDDAGLDDPWP